MEARYEKATSNLRVGIDRTPSEQAVTTAYLKDFPFDAPVAH